MNEQAVVRREPSSGAPERAPDLISPWWHVAAIVVFLTPVLLAAGGNDSSTAATAAARELSRQLFYFQNTISSIPGPSMGRGLYQQCDGVQTDLIYFQQQLKRQVAREEL